MLIKEICFYWNKIVFKNVLMLDWCECKVWEIYILVCDEILKFNIVISMYWC